MSLWFSIHESQTLWKVLKVFVMNVRRTLNHGTHSILDFIFDSDFMHVRVSSGRKIIFHKESEQIPQWKFPFYLLCAQYSRHFKFNKNFRVSLHHMMVWAFFWLKFIRLFKNYYNVFFFFFIQCKTTLHPIIFVITSGGRISILMNWLMHGLFISSYDSCIFSIQYVEKLNQNLRILIKVSCHIYFKCVYLIKVWLC